MDQQPPPITDPLVHSVHAANPTPTPPSVLNHPPYAEMITAAIAALNERNGSSKKAIVKYIESQYSNLPPTHSALLTFHLKRLKDSGQILMVKYSYKLPGSVPEFANTSVSDAATSPGPKKRPGRPSKANSVQAAVPVFDQQSSDAIVVVPEAGDLQNAAGSASGSIRGRGRPRGSVKRSRGRPRKIVTPPAARVKRLGRSRGRPRLVNSMEGGVATGAGGAFPLANGEILRIGEKRRGRPPKDGADAKKPRKLGAKPLGRPKKNSSDIGSQTMDNQLLVAYLDLKGKLDYIQTRIKQTTSLIKPHLNDETALGVMQELETLASLNVSASIVQTHLPQPQELETEQPQQQNESSLTSPV